MSMGARVERSLAQRSVTGLTRAACFLALLGLAVMAFSILVPKPLPVIMAMSLGQGIGVAAFACYLLAVLVDVLQTSRAAEAASVVAVEDNHDDNGEDKPEDSK